MKTALSLRVTLLALFLGLTVGARAQVVLAKWTFETSIPTTGGPLTPEIGTGSATSNTGGTFSNPVGNGSAESWSSNGWDVGDYFQFTVNGEGYSMFALSWNQTGSNTGPKSFALAYSLDGTNFTNLLSYDLLNVTWSSGAESVATTDDFSFSLALPELAAGEITFRLADTSTVAINGTTVASTGTNRVDNFSVTGSIAAVPEPSTYAAMLAGLALVGGVSLYRRRRNAA